MLRAFYSSATGMRAQELLIDNTANNLANVNTSGFKRSQVDFADLLYSTERAAGSEVAAGQVAPIGLQIGSGVRVVGTSKVFTPGNVQETGISTDVAIEGDGFFKIEMPSGDERFTRDGSFRIDNNGLLVTSEGFVVDGNITVPNNVSANNLRIGVDGTVSAIADGTSVSLGTLPLYRFVNPMGLQSEGGNLYAATPASGDAEVGISGDNVGMLRQGFIEGSNVEVVRELVSLITAQRAYEINSRAIQAGDEMLSNTAQLTR
ncbi:MAG: flagellar basal-body rod protein FlgG [Planctomycetaceae bacterium]|nr:flagellar basal-body rod protein FlgG [Planctomycetaceae bacterium]MCP4462291.1 flagellar basal-body rod protein FlgG [Planctomycetaceae bacterium]MDG1808129.1 flagellar basal-body rod protein FlgG [Pirellulaceae bacterium]MDG2103874.1 flagellar basal-body rod protein FlgG [Pirellulaceae bacterium]